ncbi:hypothetical protein [Echinicola strongylocentroti]|uniref:hypothetical protein n=1 Tax=Echinicola strongylocentroti TaxID=1795355 RepID=UPI001FE5820A|nr:hypothetical protein [Echinicola strongylocentroti]
MKDAFTEDFPLTNDVIKHALHWASEKYTYLSYHHPNTISYPMTGFVIFFLLGTGPLTGMNWDHTPVKKPVY